MNKGQRFWHDLWESGLLPFHRAAVNDDLIQFWPFLPAVDKPVMLVPLCGKSLDLLWLVAQGAQVIGVELSEVAVQQLAAENDIPLQRHLTSEGLCYAVPSLTIWVGDIFTLPAHLIAPADGIYDRGALVALPSVLRPDYVRCCLQWLKPEGRILLKTCAYDETLMTGPPYSVRPDELSVLYPGCTQQLLQQRQRNMDASDHLFARGLRDITDYVWLIERN